MVPGNASEVILAWRFGPVGLYQLLVQAVEGRRPRRHGNPNGSASGTVTVRGVKAPEQLVQLPLQDSNLANSDKANMNSSPRACPQNLPGGKTLFSAFYATF